MYERMVKNKQEKYGKDLHRAPKLATPLQIS